MDTAEQAEKAEKKVAIIGVGMMGTGIAVACARAGLSVKSFGRRKEAIEQSRQEAKAILQRLVKNEFLEVHDAGQALANIGWTGDIAEAVRDCDVVIESISEILEIKQQVFKQLDELSPFEALLASNTSAIRITDIASTIRKPERVVGLHWINPPYLLPRVEVNRGEKTSTESIRRAQRFVLQLGQIPCVTKKDVPGFVGARLRTVVLNEAIRLVEQGVVSIEDVDNIARFGFVIQLLPHGPLGASDLAAPKSLAAKAGDFIYSKTGEERYRAPKLLWDKASVGELPWVPGEPKTTKGWYDYTGQQPEAVLEKRDLKIGKTVKLLEELGIIEDERQRIRASI
jgi:3-hydroxybutyryl-CoA dehydrogenase